MILVIDCGSTKSPFILEAVDAVDDCRMISMIEFKLTDLEDVNGVIISGAPRLVTEIELDPILEIFNWIKEEKLPVLGICFGHQVIGLLYGAYPSRIKEDRDWQEIDCFQECPILDKLPPTIRMVEDHCEAISVPYGFSLVGSSDACVNEIMMHQSKPIFGVQFHPEVSGNHGAIIIENFVHLCN